MASKLKSKKTQGLVMVTSKTVGFMVSILELKHWVEEKQQLFIVKFDFLPSDWSLFSFH